MKKVGKGTMKAGTIFGGIAILFLSFAIAVTAKAQTATAAFRQALADYQAVQDHENAEKVITMAAAMRQLPPIPEEARHHLVRGAALFKAAHGPEDFEQVIDEFGQAARLAPWWPEARYNLALSQEAAGLYSPAINNLKFYLLFRLPAADARAAQDKIYALEVKQEQAAKAKAASDAAAAVAERERAQAAAAAAAAQQKAREEQEFDAWLHRLNGKRATVQNSECSKKCKECCDNVTYYVITGKTIVVWSYFDPDPRADIPGGLSEQEGFEIRGHKRNGDGSITLSTQDVWQSGPSARGRRFVMDRPGLSFVISQDGRTISIGQSTYNLQ